MVVDMIQDACQNTINLLEANMNETLGRTSKLIRALSKNLSPKRESKLAVRGTALPVRQSTASLQHLTGILHRNSLPTGTCGQTLNGCPQSDSATLVISPARMT